MKCEFCGADIHRPLGWLNLWRASGTPLSIHNPEYCPESRSHTHQPEEETK